MMVIESYEGRTIMEWALRCKVLEQLNHDLNEQVHTELANFRALAAQLERVTNELTHLVKDCGLP